MYMSSGTELVSERVKGIGSPTVVVALLKFGRPGPQHSVFPALHKVFVGACLGLADVGAEVFYRAPVPPDYIERIEDVPISLLDA